MTDVVVVAAAVALLTVPANWVVRYVLRAARGVDERPDSGAGRWIGALERLLVFVLVVMGEAGAAGLVVAAKSIIRFPEISAKPAKIDPEYVLVGSLTSWLIAFAVGAATARLL